MLMKSLIREKKENMSAVNEKDNKIEELKMAMKKKAEEVLEIINN